MHIMEMHNTNQQYTHIYIYITHDKHNSKQELTLTFENPRRQSLDLAEGFVGLMKTLGKACVAAPNLMDEVCRRRMVFYAIRWALKPGECFEEAVCQPFARGSELSISTCGC
jgi:hypothetical protein